MKEESEEKFQVPIEERNESAKPVNVAFTFYKFLEFLELLYNSI